MQSKYILKTYYSEIREISEIYTESFRVENVSQFEWEQQHPYLPHISPVHSYWQLR